MQNKRVQRIIIWAMVFLIVVSGLLFGLSMLTTM
ncbi:stressosome-associated protein Prli42 [Aliicoccus persicus]|uniref:Stressosome-associated protein Prli42 n=1 Tax=Aliicoccus persicus TaxID=930138 RepID=A0A921DXT4_9STAP|nr:stressosome-associated protein Prli42 [Aliicoccus persicus]HJE20181.1 stressosome-associated protein Prli42 [Aliicoccus persicus]